MDKVQSITFVFENCESLEFPIRYFGLVNIEDIQTNVRRLAMNSVKKIEVAKEVFLEIFAEANKVYDWYNNCYPFVRLMKYPDIVYLDIKYEDGDVETIYVDTTNAERNMNQDMWVSKLGNLYISISKRRLVSDFIYEKDANNAIEVNMRKSIELMREIPVTVDFPVPVESA